VAWHAVPRLRLDGFVDAAALRDPGMADHAQGYLGLGAGAEVPLPFGSLIGIEWGYGVQGRAADGGRGTHVVKVTGYKLF
jgi:hypothetical protein